MLSDVVTRGGIFGVLARHVGAENTQWPSMVMVNVNGMQKTAMTTYIVHRLRRKCHLRRVAGNTV